MCPNCESQVRYLDHCTKPFDCSPQAIERFCAVFVIFVFFVVQGARSGMLLTGGGCGSDCKKA
jgi:hypothetical protein